MKRSEEEGFFYVCGFIKVLDQNCHHQEGEGITHEEYIRNLVGMTRNAIENGRKNWDLNDINYTKRIHFLCLNIVIFLLD